MHDAFRRPGGPGGERQVADAVRVVAWRVGRGTWARKCLGCQHRGQHTDGGKMRHRIGEAVGTPTRLGEQHLAAQRRDQRGNVRRAVGPVQRRIAGDTFARAGQEGDQHLQPAVHPDGGTIAANQAEAAQVRRGAVHPGLQRSPGQRARGVARGLGIGPGGSVGDKQVVQRLLLPTALRVITPCGGGMVQGEERAHRRIVPCAITCVGRMSRRAS